MPGRQNKIFQIKKPFQLRMGDKMGDSETKLIESEQKIAINYATFEDIYRSHDKRNWTNFWSPFLIRTD